MFKNLHLWLPSYLTQRRPRNDGGTTHLLFCFVDHYEPLSLAPDKQIAQARLQQWTEHYTAFADSFRDADGRPPQHTFFFPAEEYRPALLDPLARLCARGYGEVEIHLHHDNDTPDNLRSQISDFKLLLRQHGCLSTDNEGNVRYGFIHGNWALDNSRADGRWCGVNNELQVLRETGCYADFTLPSAPSDTQTRKINSIYYVTDDPHQPKSHDTGVDVRVGGQASGDLLLIQGPLGLNWRDRKWGVLPHIEHGDVAGHTPVTPNRIDLWVKLHIGVVGRPDWVFVKVHTHGAQERNFDATHGVAARRMHEYLQRHYNDGTQYRLHYVTARELYNLVKAAEAGQGGDPGQYRDFVLPPPPVRNI